uniref:Uncharacterized protein n=1 Tax=Onchocerca volvulus TaxID=6282 RepID=A0A8R1Y2H2_ONCVO
MILEQFIIQDYISSVHRLTYLFALVYLFTSRKRLRLTILATVKETNFWEGDGLNQSLGCSHFN